jgi:hypothetical protein
MDWLGGFLVSSPSFLSIYFCDDLERMQLEPMRGIPNRCHAYRPLRS